MAISIAQYFVKKRNTVPAGQTLVLDQLKTSQFKSLEYEVSYLRASDDAEKQFKISVGKGDQGYEEQVFAIRGQKVRMSFIGQLNGTNYELVFTNSEATAVEVTYLRKILTRR